MKKLQLLILLTLYTFPLLANDIYLSQSGGGAGTSCSSTLAYTFFNNSANWPSPIGPGTTIHLCGTFTASPGSSSYLQFQGSGSSGNPVTILFESGAIITSTYWSGYVIDNNGQNYTTVNGANTGTIQATANGTNLANQQDNGICVGSGGASSNNIVENLTCSNIYVHVCTGSVSTCTDEGGQNTYGVRFIDGSNLTINHNIIHDAKWCSLIAYGTSSTGLQISNNTITSCDHGAVIGDETTGDTGTGVIFGNDISNMNNWDDAADMNHHDGIHTWANNSGSSYTVQTYNNYLHGNGGAHFNAWIYSELAAVNSIIYNNLIVMGSNCLGGTGLIGLASSPGGTNTQIYNNTIQGNGPSDSCSGIGIQEQVSGTVVKNNIVYNVNTLIYIPTAGQIAASGINNNLWFNSASGFWCPGNVDVNFATWQSGCTYDSAGAFANPNLNGSFVPNVGSPAIGLGANLTSLSITPLDSDKNGNLRPSVGNWTSGAFNFTSQATGISVTAVSSQQVKVHFTAPDSTACLLSATSHGTLIDPVNDLNATYFTNANVDLDRQSTVAWGGSLQRDIEIGKRTTEYGNDNILHSRSLQANTSYTLTINCDSSPVNINFTTKTITPGASNPDPVDFNIHGFRNIAWPNFDWSTSTGPSQVLVDHKTGMALRPANWFNQIQFYDQTQLFGDYYDAGAGWTNPQNIITNGASFATVTTTDPIFVAINSTNTNLTGSENYATNRSIVHIRINFNGNCGGSTCPLDFCLSIDSGQTCFTGTQSITIPASTGCVAFPNTGVGCGGSTANLVAPFSEFVPTSYPAHNLLIPVTTTVNTSGTAITNTITLPTANPSAPLSGVGLFPVNIASGSKIHIAGSGCSPNDLCTISNVTNVLGLTTVENTGTLTAANTYLANFGVKIFRPGSPSGTLSLNLTYDIFYEDYYGFSIADGASDQCSSLTFNVTRNSQGSTTAATPVTLCHLDTPDGTNVLLSNPATGETWSVGQLYTIFGSGFADSTGSQIRTYNPFDTTNANVLYSICGDSGGSPQVCKFTYRGNGTPYFTGPLGLGNVGEYRSPPNGQSASGTTCSGGEQTAGNMCVSLLTTSISNDLVTGFKANDMLANATPNPPFNTGFPLISPGVYNGHLLVTWGGSNGQDSIYGFSGVNLSTGVTDFAYDSMFLPNAKYCAVHTASAWFIGNEFQGMICNALGNKNSGPYSGPYKSLVIDNCTAVNGSGVCTNYTSTTSITSGFVLTCPTAISGCNPAVTNALLFRIQGQFCNPLASAGEIANYPCPTSGSASSLSNIAVGDIIGDAAQLAQGEAFKVLNITINSSTDIALWVQRGVNNTIPQAHSNGWTAAALPTGGGPSAFWWLDTTSSPSPGELFLQTGSDLGAHIDFGLGPNNNTFNYIGGTSAIYNAPATSTGITTSPVYNIFGWGTWQSFVGNNGSGSPGNVGFQGNGRVEYYGSCRQNSAPNFEKVWCADARNYQGGSFTSGGAGTGQDTVFIIPITAGGRAHVYSLGFSNGAGSNYYTKIIPAESWAGGFIYQDLSSPSTNTFVDASGVNVKCIPYKNNECVTGSTGGGSVGYYSATNTINSLTASYTNNIEVAAPNLVPTNPIAPYYTETNITFNAYNNLFDGPNYRRMTMAFNGPSRGYTANNWRPFPSGKWGFFPTQFADGIFPIMMLGYLPTYPKYDSEQRFTLVNLPFQVNVGGVAFAEIRFGYEEYGTPGQFYCTTRQEACLTIGGGAGGATLTNPFNWLTADGHSGTACSTGCTITVPAQPNRFLWYQIYSSPDGTTFTPVGQVQSVLVR